MGFKTAPASSGGSGSSAIEDNSGTPALASGITEAEIRSLLNIEDSDIVSAVESESDSNTFTDADHSKLDGIEASADVTDATNVQAAGALMDSEVTNLADVKSFDPADYATAAQGTTADNALPKIATVNTNQSPASSAADSGEYFYITSGSFTLPNITSVGEQYVVLNNKGSSLSIGKDASDSIVGATSIDDDKVATIVAVTTSTWFVVG